MELHLKPATAIPSNLIVNYLPPSINSDEALTRLFSPYGEVESCKLMINKHTGIVPFIHALRKPVLINISLLCIKASPWGMASSNLQMLSPMHQHKP